MKKTVTVETFSSRTFLKRPQAILLSLALLGAAPMAKSTPFVEVTSFEVQANEKAGIVTLKWTTGAEIDNNAFFVKRSRDQVVWRTLHTITTQNNSTELKDYHFIDDNPLQGTSYYSLEWRSNDGALNSSTLQVTFGEASLPNDDAALTEDATVVGFKASYLPESHKVHMKWATVTEDENDIFVIKRASEPGAWVQVAEVTSAFNSNEPLVYTYLERDPVPGKMMYRLEWTHEGNISFVDAEVEVGLPSTSKANASHVSLESFQGRYDRYSGMVDLAWRTSLEVDNERFIVYRSKNQQEWKEVGRTMGALNSSAITSYSMQDKDHYDADTYYKLEWREGADLVYSLIKVDITMVPVAHDSHYITRSAVVNDLSATPKNNMGDMEINWNTSTESDNAWFIIYRSRNQTDWQRIESIPGVGNSSITQEYSYEDHDLAPGTVHYRLDWHDNQGIVASEQITAEVPSGATAYRSVPNPTTDRVVLSSSRSIDHTGRVKVVAADGQSYKVPTALKNGELVVDMASLPKGLYIIQLKDGYARVQKN